MKHLKISCQKHKIDSLLFLSRCMTTILKAKSNFTLLLYIPWHVYTWASLCGLPLRLEAPGGVWPMAWHSLNIRATRKCSDQTAHMRRLIWDFAGRTYHIDGGLMLQLKCSLQMTLQNIFSLFDITSGFRQIRILYFTALCAYIQQRNLQNTCQK